MLSARLQCPAVGATLLLPDRKSIVGNASEGAQGDAFAVDETTGAEITERPLPESAASDLVGGLDLNLYQNLFGLDLNGLVAGSEGIAAR